MTHPTLATLAQLLPHHPPFPTPPSPLPGPLRRDPQPGAGLTDVPHMPSTPLGGQGQLSSRKPCPFPRACIEKFGLSSPWEAIRSLIIPLSLSSHRLIRAAKELSVGALGRGCRGEAGAEWWERGMHCSASAGCASPPPILPTTTHAGFWRVWEKPDTRRPRPAF